MNNSRRRNIDTVSHHETDIAEQIFSPRFNDSSFFIREVGSEWDRLVWKDCQFVQMMIKLTISGYVWILYTAVALFASNALSLFSANSK